jgi:hypothetical protein
MRINFYEEFPTNRNLAKLKLVPFGTKVFLAAHSLDEFFRLKKQVNRVSKNAEAHYWPVLTRDEGYWMSPFSNGEALKRIIGELKREKSRMKVVWDAEIPARRFLLLKNIPLFFGNKETINEFLKNAETYNKDIMITENLLLGASVMGNIFGLYFDPKIFPVKKTIMFYTSMIRSEALQTLLLKRIAKLKNEIGDRLTVGLGTIAPGVEGDEPLLKTDELDKDLEEMVQIGIDEVIIYRLGGLNEKYLKVIEKYVN